jgi:Zn-dependent peptidase ImmA (M78 family)
MRWVDAHHEAMAVAADAQDELGLDEFERIDIFEAMNAAGVKLMFRPLDCAALYLPATLGGRPGTIIHSGHPLALQRFSAAHEYGHHVFGHGEQVDREAEPRGTRVALPPEEKLAEAFAAWFLMGPEAVELALERIGCGKPSNPADAYALALRLGTSFRATCIHLPSLKLTGPEAKAWADVSLKSIKAKLTDTPPPGGWKNDVWLVTEADAAPKLVVRGGDRLLFEIAGSAADELPVGATATKVPPPDLLSTPRLCIDISPEMVPGPTSVTLSIDDRVLRFELVVEQPRRGRFVPLPRVAL